MMTARPYERANGNGEFGAAEAEADEGAADLMVQSNEPVAMVHEPRAVVQQAHKPAALHRPRQTAQEPRLTAALHKPSPRPTVH